ncbi:uncharacterized protein LOC131168339 [Malania oleifera]|uniref:uncharacterized protein LOC131168339 n=1 Tax=Malania oleifera TaxID=397392 RepID=UPI0025AE7BA9|nr:uncharacterized protein LOC131168339 [Malania oleifera]
MDEDGNGSLEIGSKGKGSIKFGCPQGSVVDLDGQIHQLPCGIKYDGPSSVSHYFKPKHTGIEVDGLRVEEAHFRGRKLQGARVPLPEGYCGFILGKNSVKKRKFELSEENSNCWEAKAKFQSITFWNHESLPSQDDVCLRSFHWFPVANALHKPVTAEDLASVLPIVQGKD